MRCATRHRSTRPYIAGPRHFLHQLLFRNIFCVMNTIVASPIFLGLNTHILQMLNLWTTLFSPEIRVILVLHFVAFSQRSLRTCQCAAVLYGLQVCLRFARLISGLRIRPDLIRWAVTSCDLEAHTSFSSNCLKSPAVGTKFTWSYMGNNHPFALWKSSLINIDHWQGSFPPLSSRSLSYFGNPSMQQNIINLRALSSEDWQIPWPQ